MNVLVDSSVWIDYFRSGKNSAQLDSYIEQNLICTNYLILSELIPFLKINKQNKVIKLLKEVSRIPMDINWEKIIDYQSLCLKNGINKIGIPDLLILDNVIQNNLTLFTLDKHFSLLQGVIKYDLLDY